MFYDLIKLENMFELRVAYTISYSCYIILIKKLRSTKQLEEVNSLVKSFSRQTFALQTLNVNIQKN